MIRKRNIIWIVIATIFITVILMGGLLISSDFFKIFLSDDSDVLDEFKQASNIIDIYFYKDIDSDKLANAAIEGMISELNDPYASYYNQEEWVEFLKDQKGEYTGIGVQVNFEEEIGGVLIVKVFENSPAMGAGIKQGDIIVGYDGNSFKGAIYEDIVKAIRGEAGTKVTVEVLRGEETLYMDIIRQVVISDQADFEVLEDGIGYFQLYSFSGNALERFYEAKDFFIANGCESIVVDLRNNPGGDLQIVTTMLDELVPKGKLIITRDRSGNEESIESDSKYWDIPMVVLTNEYSASASELFSIAVQDYERGQVVGETTYGKGVVQTIMPLGIGDTGIKLTTSEYFSPLGRSIDGQGVYPDHNIVDEDMLDEEDVQLDFAVDLLTQ